MRASLFAVFVWSLAYDEEAKTPMSFLVSILTGEE
jgi:hypothetical protein